jgi:hypothetical protein
MMWQLCDDGEKDGVTDSMWVQHEVGCSTEIEYDVKTMVWHDSGSDMNVTWRDMAWLAGQG